MAVNVEPRRAEYVTDVAYLRNFVEDLSPSRLRIAAALNGFAPPPARDFDYCELGSGNGDTTATLAAAYPDARFVGVDVNPEHTAFAAGLAQRGGLGNVRFLERDFADLGREDLPAFDFITAHGVLSWVSPAKRRALLDFAAAKLKPGGLLYVSYNALPGWAVLEPLRRLMLDSAAGVPGTSLDRARHALAQAKLLSEAGAGYFTENPAARSMLETMTKTGLSYVTHEFFHAHWCPMYFADVAREMAAGGLYFVAELPLYLNYRDLALPPALGELFKGVDNRVVFESLKDFAVNEFFRRDVYVKGQAACSEAATLAYLDSTAFAAPAGVVPRDVRLPHYTLSFVGPVFDALIPALAESAATVSELARRPALAAFGVPRIRSSVLRLALAEKIAPMLGATLPAVTLGALGAPRYRVPLAYNRAILEQRLSSKNLVALASPVAGTGIVLSMMEAVGVHLLTAVEPGGREAWLRRFVAESPLKLSDGDRPIADKEEQLRVLAEQVEGLRVRRLPELLRLGILAEA
jgi:SAM-dependent methyltransferase